MYRGGQRTLLTVFGAPATTTPQRRFKNQWLPIFPFTSKDVQHDLPRMACNSTPGSSRSRANVQPSCVKPAAALAPWALAIRTAAGARSTALRMAGDEGETEVAVGMPKPPVEPMQEKSNLPFFLDPSTRRVLSFRRLNHGEQLLSLFADCSTRYGSPQH